LCNQNPRYFNGGMLGFESFDPDTGVIQARVEQYKHHAVRDAVNIGISLLAVTGVLCARDGDQTKYMIGKRSPAVHRYSNLWEFGPCGGVDVPPSEIDALGFDAIVQELNRESIEETGIDLSRAQVTPLAMVHDDAVGSVDIVLCVELPHIPTIKSSWEYAQTQWVRLDDLNEQIKSDPRGFIPTTAAIAQLLAAKNDYD
jgi:8-oxo-dGTP pyrophosphatase MutT (NUDIX family)